MSRSSFLARPVPAMLCVSLLLPSCAASETEVSVQVQDRGDKVGTVLLTGEDGTTHYEMRFYGLSPSKTYLVTLHGGDCENPSASFTRLSEITTDEEGSGEAEGSLLFRERDAIDLKTIADGAHAVVVKSDNRVACGMIPSLDR